MSRSRHLDILNIAACASVVVLHATSEVFNFSQSGTWWAAILLQSLGHFAVPVFFMLSGATLLDYRQRYTTREYFHKRWQRIGVPFIFWTCFYVLWNQLVLKAPALTGPLDVFNMFINNGASNIFWFFYALVPIYLLIPVFSLIDWQKNQRVLFYLLALFFLFNQILPLFSRFAGIGITSYVDLPFNASYLDYALLGYFLQHLRLTPLRRGLLLAGGVVGFAGMAGGTWLLSRPAGVTDTFLMDYHSLFCYMSAIAVFVLVRSLCEGRVIEGEGIGKQRGNVLSTLSGASFGVYLIHILVLTVLTRLVVFPHPILLMTAGAVLVYGISLGLTLLIKEIPFVKRIMP